MRMIWTYAAVALAIGVGEPVAAGGMLATGRQTPACQWFKNMKPSDEDFEFAKRKCENSSVDYCNGVVRRSNPPEVGWYEIDGDEGCFLRGSVDSKILLKVCPVGTRCEVVGWSGELEGMQQIWSVKRLK